MFKAIFNFKNQETTILCKDKEKIKEIIKKLAEKIDLDLNNTYFIYNGKIVNEKLTYIELINQEDKKRKAMNIIVDEINTDIEKDKIKRSKDIICPKCKQQILIKFDDFKINLENCENGHDFNDLSMIDFIKKQNIDMSKIICNNCKENNMANIYQNIMYYCLNCRKNLCPLCKSNHEKSHKIVNFDEKNIFCNKHKDTFSKFCETCDKNICMRCEKEHQNHTTIYLGDLLKNDDEEEDDDNENDENNENDDKEFKEYIDKFNADIKNIIKKLENVMNYINEYYNMSINYIKENKEKRNYYILKNLNVFKNYNDVILSNIKDIVDEDNAETKLKYLFNISDKIEVNEDEDDGNDDIEKKNKSRKTNYIEAEVDISYNSINYDYKIINSYEQVKTIYFNNNFNYNYNYDFKIPNKNENDCYNEKEIKDNCILKIDDEIIPFSYTYKFSKVGKHKIQYIFKKN